MQLVDNHTFLERLHVYFEAAREKGTSLWLTHKRLTHDGGDATMASADGENDAQEYPCLIRLTDGHDTKMSTHVAPGQLDTFHTAYGALLKSSMTTLRKRDKKREKEKSDKIAASKKRISQPIVIEGPKKGNGRRKRQRLVKAALKQEEARRKFQEREQSKA